MPKPIIRPVLEEDCASVSALWNDSWHDGHAAHLPPEVVAQRNLESFAGRLPAMLGMSLLAEVDGRVAGFGAAIGNQVDQLYVARSSRGTGLAADLLGALEDMLRRDGVQQAEIECATGNVPALVFYKKHGWQHVGVMERALWMPEGQSLVHAMCILAKDL